MESSSLRCEEGAEAGRRLGEPVDLLLERHDLVARLAEGLRQPLVLGGDGGQGALRVGEPELDAARVARRVLQAAAQVGDLGLQEAHLARELRQRLVVASDATWRHLLCLRPYPRGNPAEEERTGCWSRFGQRAGSRVDQASSGSPVGEAAGPAAADRCSRRRTRPAPGGASSSAAAPPAASRRAVTRNAVWPIILCPGRTARPSTCQSRTSDSQACGSVKPPCARSVSTISAQLGGGRDVRADDAAGHQRVGDRVDALPRREHVEDDPVGALAGGRQRLGEVAEAEAPGRVRSPPKNWVTLARATSANSSRRSYDDTRPCGPTARSSEQVSAPDPTPASTTRAPGKMSAMRDDLGGVLGVDHGRAARHRHHELAEQRAEDEVLPAGRRRDREPLLAADQVVVLEVALVGEEALAGHQLEVVAPALLVGQPHPLARAQRAAVHAGPGLGRDVGIGHDADPSAGGRGPIRPVRRLRFGHQPQFQAGSCGWDQPHPGPGLRLVTKPQARQRLPARNAWSTSAVASTP